MCTDIAPVGVVKLNGRGGTCSDIAPSGRGLAEWATWHELKGVIYPNWCGDMCAVKVVMAVIYPNRCRGICTEVRDSPGWARRHVY